MRGERGKRRRPHLFSYLVPAVIYQRTPRPVQHNQTLTPDELRAEAVRDVEDSGLARSPLASVYQPGAVSLALNEGATRAATRPSCLA